MALKQIMRCPVHGNVMVSRQTIPFTEQEKVVREPVFYCGECGRYYIHTELVAYGTRFDYGDKEVVNIENQPEDPEKSFWENTPLSFEECEKCAAYAPLTLLCYAFLFRRFDVAKRLTDALSQEELEEALHSPGPAGLEWITPLVCMKWNLSYLLAYGERNPSELVRRLEPYLEEAEDVRELAEYTDVVDGGQTVFSLFWKGKQPLLDVIYYQRQELAARQVRRNGFSLVMDEVGTGKTVSALYAIRDVLNETEVPHILVVCPSPKREDWQNDIRRQLGRFAHIVEQYDPGELYEGRRKKAFFRKREPVIMISGQIRGLDANGSHSALKGTLDTYAPGEPWDLVIIDEAHMAFESYRDLSAHRLMLLTATPVVVNVKGRRTYEDYQMLARRILGRPVTTAIDPIRQPEPSEEDGYVNWFREDLGRRSARRKIRFISCKRWAERENVFQQIREKAGTLAALQYDQDDEYLFIEAREHYNVTDVPSPDGNAKLNRLTELLREDEKSFIIFCEHQFVADNLFHRLKNEFRDSVTAEKYGAYEDQRGLEYVQEGQLVNTLAQVLRSRRRVLFITTGKTGGTGLNLGEFDGVIHYELPFTSTELEQRFGRVDRLDTTCIGEVKDMVFLLNECRPDENDLEQNRMLYYCTTKIDITCQYMPVRNTVLYYPEFIRRNGKAIRDALEAFQKEYILSEENEREVKRIHRTARSMERMLMEDALWQYVAQREKNPRACAWEALNRPRDPRIPEEYYERLRSYLEFWRSTVPRRNDFQKMYRSFKETRNSAYHWFAAVGMIRVAADDEIFTGLDSQNEQTLSQEGLDRPVQKGMTVRQQITELLELLDAWAPDEEALGRFSSDGIFCYWNGKIRRMAVSDYRAGHGWE